ncbi:MULTISPECIES: hypothetical protein [unclassified Candidatus Frackibacter]|uniref:hypothetical protein n=1 Tax=unclassified Candidatus Frackibacter TaxID=2648818 RepID=UPI0007999EF1|nr:MULTISPECIES: hypothetical protein [unclassified Candidatus Frackibacter]KXS41546.1 MAG: hypothetical protein AWU54_1604 [Candidatus Frackibacter sp. T328-2]SDC33271.1 hypothetical protein SAMN04515661_1079 [Candidatus Frackibacter sp. WG11]SEM57824.1 hypothetical protein SAMN04488698_107108 [Candidatus Frackibacter sp. WG12]SFM09558.1 hypothetical protein SAMN04488699_13614 [Candidatus Frackibacter sp. WG13]
MKSKVLAIMLALALVVIGGSTVFAHEVDQQQAQQQKMHDGNGMGMMGMMQGGMMGQGKEGSNNHMKKMMKKCMSMMQQMSGKGMHKIDSEKTMEKTKE